MSSTSMGSGRPQVVNPPQRGIFPLDHGAECREPMQGYLQCLKQHSDKHHPCKEASKAYLQCRMDHQLMANEDLDHLGYGKEQEVKGAKEYDFRKEKEGFVAYVLLTRVLFPDDSSNTAF